MLDAVIGLPSNLFTTTGIPVAILVFDRSREQGGPNEKRKDVFFVDASRDYTPAKTQNILERSHIDKIVETYQKRKEIDKYSHSATPKEIAENNYNLNIPRYVDTFEPEAAIDVAAVQKEIAAIEAELADVRNQGDALDPNVEKTKIQGVRVLPTRKPRSLSPKASS